MNGFDLFLLSFFFSFAFSKESVITVRDMLIKGRQSSAHKTEMLTSTAFSTIGRCKMHSAMSNPWRPCTIETPGPTIGCLLISHAHCEACSCRLSPWGGNNVVFFSLPVRGEECCFAPDSPSLEKRKYISLDRAVI